MLKLREKNTFVKIICTLLNMKLKECNLKIYRPAEAVAKQKKTQSLVREWTLKYFQ